MKEWIDFHLLAGWNFFSIYDDNSNDSLLEIIGQYPKDVLEYTNYSFYEKDLSATNPQIELQKEAYKDCFLRHWNTSDVLTTFDADEFMFPAPEFWNEIDPLGKAFEKSQVVNSTRQKAFVSFIFNARFEILVDPLPSHDNTNQIVSLRPRRLPFGLEILQYPFLEMFPEAKNLGCDLGSTCHEMASTYGYNVKVLYFPNGQPDIVVPDIHWPRKQNYEIHDEPYVVLSSVYNRSQCLILFNHYFAKDLQHMCRKGVSNNEDIYRNLCNVSTLVDPRTHPFIRIHQVVNDTQAIDFVKRMTSNNKNNDIHWW